jgi:hypothetical protein
MFYSKLIRYVSMFSFFVLLISVYSCKKDEASPTASNIIPATSTAETKALLEGFTWRGIGYRVKTGAGQPVDPVANILLYRFVDTTGTFRVNNAIPDKPYYVDLKVTTPRGVYIANRVGATTIPVYGLYTIDGNRITIESLTGKYFTSGAYTYYCLFKDSLMYLNDYPSLTSTDKYHDPAADIPMMTFKKQ